MKKILVAAVVAMLTVACGPKVQAQEVDSFKRFNFTVDASSLNKERGIDQERKNTNLEPVVKLGVAYNTKLGVYASAQVVNGSYGESRSRVSLATGLKKQFTDVLSYDIGYGHQYFQNNAPYNNGGAYVGVTYGTTSFYMHKGTGDYIAQDGEYYVVSYKLPLTKKLQFVASGGYTVYDSSQFKSRGDGMVGLEYKVDPYSVIYTHVTGSGSKREVTDGSRNTRLVVGLRSQF